MSTTPTPADPRETLIRQAINMIGEQDLCHWSDAHDRVALEALRDSLSSQPPSAQEGVRDEREAFEAWAGSIQSWIPNIGRQGTSYKSLPTSAAWHAWQARAALAGQAKSEAPRIDWQQRALDHGFKYWRAPDAHGVTATQEQALNLLRDLLGVEVDVEGESSGPVKSAAPVEPAGWLRDQRGEYEGPATLDTLFMLGKMVRAEWVKWAHEQDNPKPSWLVPWDQLTEPEREVDRRIGEAIWRFSYCRDASLLPVVQQAPVQAASEWETHEAWWTEIKGDAEFNLTTKNQSYASWAERGKRATQPAAQSAVTDEQLQRVIEENWGYGRDNFLAVARAVLALASSAQEPTP